MLEFSTINLPLETGLEEGLLGTPEGPICKAVLWCWVEKHSLEKILSGKLIDSPFSGVC